MSKFRSDSSDSASISEYTSKRLEELRARRTAAASSAAASGGDSYAEYKARREARENGSSPTTTSPSSTTSGSPTSTGGSTVTPGSLEYVSDTVRMRRPGDSATSQDTKTVSSITSSSAGRTGTALSTSSNRDISSYNSSSNKSGSKKQDGDEFVGFASLPEQVHRKAVKRGFDFTLMVVGETGLGKSTLISSLFLNDLYKDRKVSGVEERISKTVDIEKKYMEIEERGVKLRLTIVDTPGFNDAVDAEKCWKPIEDYINAQFNQYYNDESGLNRKNIKDNRVHCCLYFVSPFGHGLRQVDIEFMRHLHDKVNIVPVIAKADTLTPREIRRLKDTVLEQVQQERIHIYEFPECDSDEDEDFKKQDQQLKASVPFSVIGSNAVVEVNGKKVRGRLYPWGIVEVDNPHHCDFGKLRLMLISTHMQDLKDVTRDIHYENFRARIVKEQMVRNQRKKKKVPTATLR